MEEFILQEVTVEDYRKATNINPLRLESYEDKSRVLTVVLKDSKDNRYVLKTPRKKRTQYFKVIGIRLKIDSQGNSERIKGGIETI